MDAGVKKPLKNEKSQAVKQRKPNRKTPYIQIALVVVIIAVVTFYYLSNSNSSKGTGGQVLPSYVTNPSGNSSNSQNVSNLNVFNQTNSSNSNQSSLNSSSSIASNSTANPENMTNQTVNYTQQCLSNSVYVGNFNLMNRNLNYSWVPYYGVFYVRIFVGYSSNLGKPYADVSEVKTFNGSDCSYTPLFEGDSVVLPECNFIMKVNSISLIGGAWVANVDISHC